AFEKRTLGPEIGEIAEIDVWIGTNRQVPVGLSEAVDISGHKRAFEAALAEVVYDGPVNAPVSVGDQIGELVITLEGQEPVRAPLVALADVSRLGFFGRAAEGLNRLMSADSRQ
ncbi:MAG: D-alanyl-D-alanine carboxypeptidase, partial [Pseudomonadota bacterium]